MQSCKKTRGKTTFFKTKKDLLLTVNPFFEVGVDGFEPPTLCL